MFEPRKRIALDGKSWWCVFDTDKKSWSTLICFGKYKRKKDCQYAIDKWNNSEVDYKNFSVGMKVVSRICPALFGKIKELNNKTAVIEVKDRNLNTKDMFIDLKYWRVCS